MTTNQPSTVDQDTFTVRRTIQIAAPPEKVWTAVTEPEHISRWFGRTVLVGEGVGAQGTIVWPEDAAPMPIRVEAMDPPRAVTYRWCIDDTEGAPAVVDDAPSTVFTFTLTATAQGTELTVEETGFEATADPAASLEDHRQGWDRELDKLVRLLEARPV